MDTLMVKGIYRDGVIIPERPVTEWEKKEVIVFFRKKRDFGLKPDRDYGRELKNIYPGITSTLKTSLAECIGGVDKETMDEIDLKILRLFGLLGR